MFTGIRWPDTVAGEDARTEKGATARASFRPHGMFHHRDADPGPIEHRAPLPVGGGHVSQCLSAARARLGKVADAMIGMGHHL
jgi:hypothetical protein